MCSRQRKKRKKFVITKEITFRLKEIVICVINVSFSLSYLRRSLSHSLCSFIVLFEIFYGACILFYEGQKGESIRVDDRFAPFSFMFPSQNIDTGGSSLLNIEKIEELFIVEFTSHFSSSLVLINERALCREPQSMWQTEFYRFFLWKSFNCACTAIQSARSQSGCANAFELKGER